MIIAFVIDKEQNLTNLDDDFSILLYEYKDGLKILIKTINFIIRSELLQALYLDRCEVLVTKDLDEEIKEKAKEYRIDFWYFGKINVLSALSRIKNNSINQGMSNTQRFVEPYELDHDFDIGYYDDDDIGGS